MKKRLPYIIEEVVNKDRSFINSINKDTISNLEDAVEFAHRITENFYETVLEEMKEGIYTGDKERWIDIYKTYLIWDRFRESKIGRDINEYIEAMNTEKGYDTTKRGEAYLNISNDICLLKIFLAKIADDND